MPENPTFKEFAIHPVTGFLDTRSNPDEVAENGYRYVDSFRVTQKHKLSRQSGWRKFLSKESYNNADLHDQLGYVRQQINSLYSAKSLAGFTKMLAGTQNRCYALNNATENYRIISDDLGGTPESGCSERRFVYAQVGNVVVLTNNFDASRYHVIDQPLESDGQAVAEIPDMERLKISKVALVVAWNNCVFYMNMVMDGERVTNRILWSDYKRPISLYPGSGSLAGRFDLDSGEDILGAQPLGDSLFVYTTHRIWEGRAVGGVQVFSFTKRYNPDQAGLRALAYKNTLVSNGESHFYWSTDGIYKYDFYDTAPVRVDWIHAASASIFDDINKSRCGVHVGGFNIARKEIWWSWAKSTENCPSSTFIVNTEFPFCSFVQEGFTAFATHVPTKPKSLREWLQENCICTIAELDQYGAGFIKEGGFCTTQSDVICASKPQNFTSGTSKVDPFDSDIVSEDYLAPPDTNSLAGILGSLTEEDICGSEYTAGECNAGAVFIMVSALDNTIKEETDVYYREVCTGYTGCGTYEKRGYRSILRSGPVSMRKPSDDKIVNRFAIEIHPEPASVPAQLLLRIGVSSQAADPNNASGRCVILWEDQDLKEIECLSDVDAQQHMAENTRPNDEMEWALYHTGRYFFYELTVLNNDVTPKDTGGAFAISRYSFNAALSPRPIP